MKNNKIPSRLYIRVPTTSTRIFFLHRLGIVYPRFHPTDWKNCFLKRKSVLGHLIIAAYIFKVVVTSWGSSANRLLIQIVKHTNFSEVSRIDKLWALIWQYRPSWKERSIRGIKLMNITHVYKFLMTHRIENTSWRPAPIKHICIGIFFYWSRAPVALVINELDIILPSFI